MELFDKCSKTSDVDFSLNQLNNEKNNDKEDILIESTAKQEKEEPLNSNIIYSYVLCSDIIDYFHKNIIDHKVNIYISILSFYIILVND